MITEYEPFELVMLQLVRSPPHVALMFICIENYVDQILNLL